MRFQAGTGFAKGSPEFRDIWGNWSLTTWQAQRAIRDAGGWTWNNFNCMLTKEGGFGGSPVDLNACGLAKSEGYPRVSHLPAVICPQSTGVHCDLGARPRALSSDHHFHLHHDHHDHHHHHHHHHHHPAFLKNKKQDQATTPSHFWARFPELFVLIAGCVASTPPTPSPHP